jgi:hypothetical protein
MLDGSWIQEVKVFENREAILPFAGNGIGKRRLGP